MKETRRLTIAENLMIIEDKASYTFPLRIHEEYLSDYGPERSFGCHWNPEVELHYVIEGSMEYQVNESVYHLKQGSGVFVNANCLHNAWLTQEEDCRFVSEVFDPILLCGHPKSVEETKYVTPLINSQFSACYLDPAIPSGARMLRYAKEIHDDFLEAKPGYEIWVLSKLYALWALLFAQFQEALPDAASAKGIDRLKKGLNFIHERYAEPITLADIASACEISKGECCRIFKRIIRQTPFDYLLRYRVRQSIPLLLGGEMNVTQISEAVGFSGASYYAEMFRRYQACSPLEYRRKNLRNG